MKTFVVASTRPSAGKTGIILGLAKCCKQRCGYIKPLGDRLLYRKKRLWDYDASLVTGVLGLDDISDEMTLGFEHSKLRYIYDEESLKGKLNETAQTLGRHSDILLVEGSRDISYGASINLDSISVTRMLDAELIFILSGAEDSVIDDLVFLKRYIYPEKIRIRGVIINKVRDLEDFRTTHQGSIEKMGINVLGILPFKPELTHITVDYLSEALFAKVLAGEGGLNNFITNIFVGDMSTDAACRHPIFSTGKKLIIASGDRSDLILASLDSDTSAIVVTNNILPPANIIAKAADRKIPLLLVPHDTFKTAKLVDDMEPLLTKTSTAKVELLEGMVRDHVRIGDLFA